MYGRAMLGGLYDMLKTWEDDAAALRRRGCGAQAELMLGLSGEMRGALRGIMTARAPLPEVAAKIDYSPVQLRRLIADGAVDGHLVDGTYWVLLITLPVKPGQLAKLLELDSVTHEAGGVASIDAARHQERREKIRNLG
jgi:hypothetical protein